MVNSTSLSSLQITLEKARQFFKRNEIDAIIKVNMASARNDDELLGLTRKLVSFFAELSGVGIGSGNE